MLSFEANALNSRIRHRNLKFVTNRYRLQHQCSQASSESELQMSDVGRPRERFSAITSGTIRVHV